MFRLFQSIRTHIHAIAVKQQAAAKRSELFTEIVGSVGDKLGAWLWLEDEPVKPPTVAKMAARRVLHGMLHGFADGLHYAVKLLADDNDRAYESLMRQRVSEMNNTSDPDGTAGKGN